MADAFRAILIKNAGNIDDLESWFESDNLLYCLYNARNIEFGQHFVVDLMAKFSADSDSNPGTYFNAVVLIFKPGHCIPLKSKINDETGRAEDYLGYIGPDELRKRIWCVKSKRDQYVVQADILSTDAQRELEKMKQGSRQYDRKALIFALGTSHPLTLYGRAACEELMKREPAVFQTSHQKRI